MSVTSVLVLVVGLGVLVAGGELLVRGGSGLGRSLGLSPLLVGLTVVAFATSAPELAVSTDAALSGAPGLAVGNVVGSNITNVLLVLGLAALVLPVGVRAQLVRTDVPVMIGASVLLLVLALDGTVSRLDGVLLVVALVVYVVASVRKTLGRTADAPATDEAEQRSRPLVDVALVAVGVALLVLGARLLVTSATTIAEAAGVSDLVIGLTVVAIGTSLPEAATSVIAAVRGERELAIGNVVGSNIFNVGAVMGISASVAEGGVPVDAAAVRFDIPVMVVVAVALLPVVFTHREIARWEAAVFLAYYAAYVTYLLLDAEDHDALPAFSGALVWFLLPLTAATLVVLSSNEVRRRQEARAAVTSSSEPRSGLRPPP